MWCLTTGFRLTGGVIAAALLSCVTACDRKAAPEYVEPPVTVRVSAPVKMTFVEKIRLQGNVEPKEYADICAREEGAIDEMWVDEGDKVSKGQKLFQTDKINLESQVEMAAQDLKVAERQKDLNAGELAICEAKYAKSKKDYERSLRLIKHNAVSESAHEETELLNTQAELQVRLAKASVASADAKEEQAKSNLAIARKSYEDSMVRAPYAAVITNRYMEKGEYAKKGDKVLRLEQPDRHEMSLLLSSRYYDRVAAGVTPAFVRRENGFPDVAAKVTYKSPTIDSTDRTFEIKIDLPAGKKFVSGMLCDVDLALGNEEGWGVPADAVMPRAGGVQVIFIAVGDRAKAVEVKTGVTDNGYTRVDGVPKLSDARVVVEGQAFLNDNSLIAIRKDEPSQK